MALRANPNSTTWPKQQHQVTINAVSANLRPEVQIWDDEKHMVHVALVSKVNDPVKKEYKTTVHHQMFSVRDYNNMKEGNHFKQYDEVIVTHMPTPEDIANKKNATLPGAPAAPAPAASAAAGPVTNEPPPQTATQKLQARYKELFGVDAPADYKFPKLQAEIKKKEAEGGTGAPAAPAPVEGLEAAQAEYKALYDADADPEATLEDLQELINAKKSS